MAILPKFKSETEIFEFFENHSGVDFMDETQEIEYPVIDKRPNKIITTLRLETNLKNILKIIARTKGIKYQTLINMWLTEKAREELKVIKAKI